MNAAIESRFNSITDFHQPGQTNRVIRLNSLHHYNWSLSERKSWYHPGWNRCSSEKDSVMCATIFSISIKCRQNSCQSNWPQNWNNDAALMHMTNFCIGTKQKKTPSWQSWWPKISRGCSIKQAKDGASLVRRKPKDFVHSSRQERLCWLFGIQFG